MPYEKIGEYEIEFAAIRTLDGSSWAAYLTIYAHSANPMHRNGIFPAQRVCVEDVFSDRKDAELEARQFALSMLG